MPCRPTDPRCCRSASINLPEEYRRTLDPFVALTAAAAVTSRLRLGTGICLVAQHDPIVLAKTTASLDLVSGGRLTLGIGVGWNEEEMADHGVDPARRRAVAREKVLAMRRLWTEDEASYHGEFVRFDPCWSWPKPVQSPHPPVVMGGAGGPVTFRHVVEYCDGWMPIHGRRPVLDKLPLLRARPRRPVATRARSSWACSACRAMVPSSRSTGPPASSAASSGCPRPGSPRCSPSSTVTPTSWRSTPEHGAPVAVDTMTPAALERATIQRRTLRVLTTGQVVGAAALAAAVTVGAFVVQDILGDETAWAGIATATVTTGTAFMSQVLSRRMQRHGRRSGLQLGYTLAALGCVVAAVGVERSSLPVFLVGLFAFGNGQAANLLARYAATDLAEPDAWPGDEPDRVRIDVRRRLRAAADRAGRGRRRGVVRPPALHGAVGVRCGRVRRGCPQHRRPPAAGPAPDRTGRPGCDRTAATDARRRHDPGRPRPTVDAASRWRRW